jgi:hypothetical protein
LLLEDAQIKCKCTKLSAHRKGYAYMVLLLVISMLTMCGLYLSQCVLRVATIEKAHIAVSLILWCAQRDSNS